MQVVRYVIFDCLAQQVILCIVRSARGLWSDMTSGGSRPVDVDEHSLGDNMDIELLHVKP